MLKQGTPKNILDTGDWSNDYGTFYGYNITFEDGTEGYYDSVSANQNKFVVGEERWYQTKETKKGIKISPAKAPEDQGPSQAKQNFKDSFKKGMQSNETDISIEKQVIYKGAVELVIAGKLDIKHIKGFMEKQHSFFRSAEVTTKEPPIAPPPPTEKIPDVSLEDEPPTNQLPF